MRPVLGAVGQHHPFRQLSFVRKTAELRGVPVRMHHGNGGIAVPQQVTLLWELLYPITHALE